MADLLSHEELLLRLEIEDFFYMEADLLDEHRYEEWLDLFTEDARYHAPMKRNVSSKEMDTELTREKIEMSWFDEGKDTLVKRVAQIRTGVHWAEGAPLARHPLRLQRPPAGLGLRRGGGRRDTGQVPLSGAPQPIGRRGQHLDRQPHRHAPQGRRSVEDLPQGDLPRPERAALQEPHQLLLIRDADTDRSACLPGGCRGDVGVFH